jgi:hypothetical protein
MISPDEGRTAAFGQRPAVGSASQDPAGTMIRHPNVSGGSRRCGGALTELATLATPTTLEQALRGVVRCEPRCEARRLHACMVIAAQWERSGNAGE